MSNKGYRLHTEISKDQVLNVNMQQDFDFLEVLSLKLTQSDAYKLHSSNYGVIVGRVLANDAFGIPNAKLSVFVSRDVNDTTEIENIYKYTDVNSTDAEGRKYNLLPNYSDDECYRVVGTFPNKCLMLDNDTYLEVYDKYWKYTTVTNQSGDYMIFGVPTGSQQLHVDIDLSDIGILSQKPRDFEYKGYNLTLFDNPNQFKESTNLESLPQIFSQNQATYVYPFWGDKENGIAAITRSDISINYKFEPTCVFLGSIISDNGSNSIGHKCSPSKNNGMNNQLVAGNGTIEMIRKTTDGLVEEFAIQGNALIDENGVWCYQIPMNLDYIGTDEYGNVVATEDPNRGIPTRAQVRFRISKTESGGEGFSRHTAKYLVPMNPTFVKNKVEPYTDKTGIEIEKMYEFGSSTPQDCFRDLYWNNVYSVKNYVPKVQTATRAVSQYYTALKGANLADDKNEIPFNKFRVDIPFVYIIVCLLFMIVKYIIFLVNSTIICAFINILITPIQTLRNLKIWKWRPFGFIPNIKYVGCLSMSIGPNDDNLAFYPGCWCDYSGLKAASCPEDVPNCRKSRNLDVLDDAVQRNLALDYNIIKLDMYQDWLNGSLYMPLWYWRKSRKKKFLFLTIHRAKNEFCDCDKTYSRLKVRVGCDIKYTNDSLGTNAASVNEREKKWHRNVQGTVAFRHGLIKRVENKDGLDVYYYSAIQAVADSSNPNPNQLMGDRDSTFKAVRLYATDIILLGNLRDDNLYGIPQFYKSLPSSTANVPPIATVQESDNASDNDSSALASEDSGETVTTGMDWGYDGGDGVPRYKNGLFMDLACTYANTKAKSCINVERLSEYGSNLDMSYNVPYADGGTIKYGKLENDGFISKLELDDMEHRAMFATMNHIGFIPQESQEEDKRTNYLVQKYKYLYPVDFDGRMQPIMDAYKASFKQPLEDNASKDYLTFRLGNDGERHFYNAKSNSYSMPVYNNSYYFFFGIKKGSTAIDKFNQMFDAECTKNIKIPFTLNVSSQGLSYCPSAYSSEAYRELYAYPRIDVSLEDIQAPYSYTLKDSDGDEKSSSAGMDGSSFTINYKDDRDHEVLNNESYKLSVVDVNGNAITKRVSIQRDMLNFDYSVVSLGTKFYDTTKTPMSFFYDNDYYGELTVSKIYVDGFETKLPSSGNIICTLDTQGGTANISVNNLEIVRTYLNENQVLTLETIGHTNVIFKIRTSDDSIRITDAICHDGSAQRLGWYRINADSTFTIKIYQPIGYVVDCYQICEGSALTTNNASYSINVPNGEEFKTSLNDVPLDFLVGNGGNTNFYSETALPASASQIDADNNGVKGWIHANDESVYNFPTLTLANMDIWSEYVNVNLNDDESEFDSLTKFNITKYKFESMFNLCKVVFSDNYTDRRFVLTSVGGVQPTLFRALSPKIENRNTLSSYTLSDMSTSETSEEYPMVIGYNYYSGLCNSTQANEFKLNYLGYQPNANDNGKRIGHYLAAFTNNGGYISRTEIDPLKKVIKSPIDAKVNPKNKSLGRDITSQLSNFQEVTTTSSTENRKAYFRALTVDKRLDYELTVIAPIVYTNYSFSSSTAPYNTHPEIEPWRLGRVCGYVYNGIEMAYDDDLNVIAPSDYASQSAEIRNKYEHTEGEVTTKLYDKNATYEYTYDASLSSNNTKLLANSNYKKRKPYEAYLNDIDLLAVNTNGAPYQGTSVKVNVGKYDYVSGLENAAVKYRALNFSALTIADSYSFENVACSYDIDVVEDTDFSGNPIMHGYVAAGDNTSFDIEFSSPITMEGLENQETVFTCLFNNSSQYYRGFKDIATFQCQYDQDFKFKLAKRESGDFTIASAFISVMPLYGKRQSDGFEFNTIEHLKINAQPGQLAYDTYPLSEHNICKVIYDDNIGRFDPLYGEKRYLINGAMYRGSSGKYSSRPKNFFYVSDEDGNHQQDTSTEEYGSRIGIVPISRIPRVTEQPFVFVGDFEYHKEDETTLSRVNVIDFSEVFDFRQFSITVDQSNPCTYDADNSSVTINFHVVSDNKSVVPTTNGYSTYSLEYRSVRYDGEVLSDGYVSFIIDNVDADAFSTNNYYYELILRITTMSGAVIRTIGIDARSKNKDEDNKTFRIEFYSD